jgi:hypothetical protein
MISSPSVKRLGVTKRSRPGHTSIIPSYENTPSVFRPTSQHSRASIPLLMLVLGLVTIGLSIESIIWLWLQGPTLVPVQDTRITAVIIFCRKKLVRIFHQRRHCYSCMGFFCSTAYRRHANSYQHARCDLRPVGVSWLMEELPFSSSFLQGLLHPSDILLDCNDSDICIVSI